MQDGECAYLSPKMQSMLAKAEAATKQEQEQPHKLDYLCGLIKDIYLDWQRFSGHTAAKQRLSQLDELLQQSTTTMQDLLAFIQDLSH